jgi:manganese/zinc/iron transport system ATP- binding protein
MRRQPLYPTDDTSPVLDVEQLTVNFGKTPILWDISVQVESGKIIGILGPNGAGKSTFIKTLMGMISPLSGKVSFFGKPLKKVCNRIAYVPQRESVDWDFPITALDLVLMGRYAKLGWFRLPRKADKEAAFHYLEKVGMGAFSKRQISELSGGQQQRIFLARALLQEADLYFFDEPFSGVDMTTQRVIIEAFHELKDQGKTIFVVHHDLHTVSSYFDEVIMLNMRLIGHGTVKKMFNDEMIQKTYGKMPTLFGEAYELSKSKSSGIV